MKLKLWVAVTRADFIILAVLLVLIGGAAARHEAIIDPILFFLTMAGVVLAHMSVNLLNEYSDSKTGIDSLTRRTPFSGGSGRIQKGLVAPKSVLIAGYSSLLIAFIIGLYLAMVSGWPVLIMMLAGGSAILFYTDFLAKWGIGEIASGLCLGSLVVTGSYYVQTSEITIPVLWLSLPPGILTMILLFLNEFPDMEADKAGGRKHLVILLGKRRAAYLYAVLAASVYGITGYCAATGILPGQILISFLTLPVAIGAVYTTMKHHDDFEKMVRAQGLNVAMVLGTDLLFAIGLII